MDVVSVPEASIHKDARPVLSQHNVGLPRQSLMIQPIPIPMSPQPTAHHHLRLRVFASDGSHVVVALQWGVAIHICLQFNKFLMFWQSTNGVPEIMLDRYRHNPSPL